MQLFAHRGVSDLAPENSVEAFSLALDQQCDGIELDVRLMSGVVVVMHDARVNRTTNGTGLVDQFTSEQWQQLDIPYYGTILSAHSTNKKGEIYLLGMGGKLLHSIDNGEHWQQLQLPSQTILHGACTTHDDSILLTGLGGQIFIVRGDKITHIPFSGRQHLSTPICASDHYQVAGEGGVYTLDQSSISVD